MLNSFFAGAREKGEKIYFAVDPLLLRDRQDTYEKLIEYEAFALFYDTQLNAYMDKSPLLVGVLPNSPLFSTLRQSNTYEKGIFISSSLKLHHLAKHLQQYMFKNRYDGELMLLRIYDPYVMYDFEILFLDKEEQTAFFSGISAILYAAPDRRVYTRTIRGAKYE